MAATTPDYAELADTFSAAGADTPAEIHGTLCGLLAAAGREPSAAWLAEQAAAFEGAEGDVAAAAAALTELEHATWLALNGAALEFEPLLPDDDESLADRTLALGAWCLGFVGGLALGGWSDDGGAGEEGSVLDIVRDLTAISQAGHEDDGESADEAAEGAYVELVEYVRISAQLAFDSLRPGVGGLASARVH